MSKPIHLGQLQTFVHVVKHGSFSAAAQRLGITQPAVSLQIRQLEKRLGTSLVERVGRRARPTAAGGELLVYAEQIDAVVAAAIDAVMRRATGALGRVRLGTGATACIFLLPRILKDLRAKGVTILMVEQNARSALEISDEGLVLELGQTRMQGPAAEILADPRVGQLFLGGAMTDAA